MIPNGLAELALCKHIEVPTPKPTADGSFLRISNITSCDRKQILDGLKVPVTNTGPNAINGFVARELGTMMHEHIQDAFGTYKNIRDFSPEVPVSMPRWLTSGHADGTYQSSESGETLLLEIKTMRNYGFRKARKEGPKEEHLFQACAYAIALDIHYVHLVYVCTDATPGRWKDAARAGDIHEWVYNIHDPFDDSGSSLSVVTTYFLEQHARMVREYFNTGVIPEGLKAWWDDEIPWECKYCPHFEICESNDALDTLNIIDHIIKDDEENNESTF